MIVFEPVWISSDEHLAKFLEIYKWASLFQAQASHKEMSSQEDTHDQDADPD